MGSFGGGCSIGWCFVCWISWVCVAGAAVGLCISGLFLWFCDCGLWYTIIVVLDCYGGFAVALGGVCRSVFCLGFPFAVDCLVFSVLFWVLRLGCRLVDFGVLMRSGFWWLLGLAIGELVVVNYLGLAGFGLVVFWGLLVVV